MGPGADTIGEHELGILAERLAHSHHGTYIVVSSARFARVEAAGQAVVVFHDVADREVHGQDGHYVQLAPQLEVKEGVEAASGALADLDLSEISVLLIQEEE